MRCRRNRRDPQDRESTGGDGGPATRGRRVADGGCRNPKI